MSDKGLLAIGSKPILITGATGFIGSHLAKELIEKRIKIKCLVRRSSPNEAQEFLKSIGAEIVYGDLTDKESLKNAVDGVDVVFHLGGGGRVGMTKEVLYKINVEGTRNILDACIQNGNIKKFIHTSTCAVMGNIRNGPADETFPPNPVNIMYSQAKTEAEKIALSYKDKISLVVVRFPGVYGIPLIKGDADYIGGVTPALMIFSSIKTGKWRYIGDGKNLTHLFYVEDCVRGIQLALTNGKPGEIYIIGDIQSVKMEEMVRTAAKAINVEEPKGHIPVFVAKFFALLFELKAKISGGKPGMSREMVIGFTSNMDIDTSKARRELGYEPQTSLEKGMKETADWFIDNGYL